MKKLSSTWYNMACVLTGISLVAGVALATIIAQFICLRYDIFLV